jgi:hypothetical protein
MSDPIVAINTRSLPPAYRGPVLRHELEHNIQGGGITIIDDSLKGLDLRIDPKTLSPAKKSTPLEAFLKDSGKADPKKVLSDKKSATKYFTSGGEGGEKSAMLAELQQYMVDNKLIKHPYDKITAAKIKETYMLPKEDAFPLRILNIAKPTKANFELLAKGLNKMVVGTGVIAAAKKK